MEDSNEERKIENNDCLNECGEGSYIDTMKEFYGPLNQKSRRIEIERCRGCRSVVEQRR